MKRLESEYIRVSLHSICPIEDIHVANNYLRLVFRFITYGMLHTVCDIPEMSHRL